MLRPIASRQFERDKTKAKKQRKNFDILISVLEKLIKEEPLEPKYCDHPLHGEWKGFRDCHVQNDWVLIYRIDRKENTVTFARLGSHAELFK